MDGVVILPSFYEAIKEFPDAERLSAYDAIIRYGLYGEVIDMPPVVKPVFTLIQPVIDSSQRRYQAAKANGSKPPREGSNPRGRPKKNQSENQFNNQSENQDIDLDSDLDIEIDSDRDSESERERESVSGREETEFDLRPYAPLSEDTFEKMRQEKMNAFLSRF